MSRNKKAQRQRQVARLTAQSSALTEVEATSQKTNWYRLVVEASTMVNNDEHIYYSQKDLSSAEAVEALREELWKKKTPLGNGLKLVICRPVFAEEIRDGLDLQQTGSVWNPNYKQPPEITSFIDSFFRLKDHFQFRQKYQLTANLSSWLAHYIAYHFYDCLSGGISETNLVILKHLCQMPRIDLTEKVYPASQEDDSSDNDRWYTIGDFLQQMEKIEDLQTVVSRLNFSVKRLPLENFT